MNTLASKGPRGNPVVTPSIVKTQLNDLSVKLQPIVQPEFTSRKIAQEFDCVVDEMLLIKQLRLCLNVQSDSIGAKVFV